MLLWKRFLPFVAVGLLLPAVPVWAAEDQPQDQAAEASAEDAKEAPLPDEIGELIKQLDADEFAQRETASEKLAAAGKPAIPALAEAATSDGLEVSTRSMRILRKLFESPDAETKAAAKEALEKIAKANHPAASPRAREAIKPKVQPPIWQPGAITTVVATKSISVSNVNGVKEIKVKEDGRKITINDDPQKGIKIEVTETAGGKQVTKTVEAKNADELKKKDKEAYEIYKQYSQGNAAGGAIQVQIQAGGIRGIQIQPRIQIQPAIPQRIQIMPRRAMIDPAKRIEMATRQLQSIGRQLQRATKDAEKTDELQKALKQLEAELKKQLAEVEKQLKEAAKELEKPAEDDKQPSGDAEPEAEQ